MLSRMRMRKRSPCNEDPPPTINPEGYKYSNKITYTGVGILRIHANPNIVRVFVFDVSVCGLSNSRRYDSYGGSDFSKDSAAATAAAATAAATAAAAAAHFREIAVDFLIGE